MTQPGEFDFSSKKAKEIFTAFEGSNLWPPSTAGDGQKMLSFSSPHPYSGGASTRSIAFSTCPDANQSRTGGVRGSGTFTRLKGPFTPSQWMELEHQALIYKHIVANVPVPSNLLAPIRRALYSYGSTASCASNFLGWGPFHLGFSRNNDPEPGRCRRTDGKKWRCSRDAVPDQKYCERHINRGRHRSRKHVEGHTGHAVTGSTSSKAGPVASSSPPSLISSNTASNGLNSMQHQLSSIQPNTVHASTSHLVSRSQGFQGLSSIPSSIGVKSNESSHSEFGIVSSDSLLNPTERISYINTTNSQPLLQFNPKEANNQQSVHHFIDDWPKDQSDGGTSDWTQLSMSIPMAPDFCSSSASPAQEKSILTNVSLSDEVDPTTHMSLGPTHFLGEPIWGSVMGGPLGEVLSNTTKEKWSVKWWRSIQQAGSSPTGVLQKSNFASVSNSSSGGSPLSTDNKTAVLEAVSHCNDLLGSAAIPTL